MTGLNYKIASSFDSENSDNIAFSFDPEKSAIRVVVTNLQYQDEIASCRLHLAMNLPESYAEEFSFFEMAPVVVLENADTCGARCFNLIDPSVRYSPGTQPRYKGEPGTGGDTADDTEGFVTSYVAFDLEVEVPAPVTYPNLFISVRLRHHSSNVIGLSLGPNVTNYLEGEEIET